MGVHRLGHLDETVRPATDGQPYRQILTRQPEDLLAELDRLIVDVVHGGRLAGGADALQSERDAHITMALRAFINHYPKLPAAHPDARDPQEWT